MAKVASLAAEVTADIGPLKTQMKQAGKSVEGFTRQARTHGARFDGTMRSAMRTSGQFQRGVQNAAFQVGDFAVQVGGGTSAVRAMSMQLPQLLGGFGVMGAVVGAAVAIIGPFATKLLEGTENAKALSDALNNVRASTEAANSAYRQFALGLSSQDELAVLDGISAKRREILTLEERLLKARGNTARGARQNLNFAREELAQMEKNLAKLRQSELQRESITEDVRATTEAERLLGEQMAQTARQAALLANETQRARNAAMEAASEFVKMQQIRSRFAGEDLLMSQPVLRTGAGEPPPAVAPAVAGIGAVQDNIREMTQVTKDELATQSQAWTEFFGDMQSTMSQGGERALKVAKAFGAAQALISTYQGAAKALTLPFPQNLAAYAKTLATGFAAVSSIKSVTAGGGSGGGGASAAVASATSPLQAVNLQLNGSSFSADSVRDLIKQINEAVEGGARIRVV